jgi:hypothetical protein
MLLLLLPNIDATLFGCGVALKFSNILSLLIFANALVFIVDTVLGIVTIITPDAPENPFAAIWVTV